MIFTSRIQKLSALLRLDRDLFIHLFMATAASKETLNSKKKTTATNRDGIIAAASRRERRRIAAFLSMTTMRAYVS